MAEAINYYHNSHCNEWCDILAEATRMNKASYESVVDFKRTEFDKYKDQQGSLFTNTQESYNAEIGTFKVKIDQLEEKLKETSDDLYFYKE